MSEIERIKKYISTTKVYAARYDMRFDDILAIKNIAEENLFAALSLAFKYGRAKGYRAAKAEVRA